eukprot:684924-Rhodomonas_salina.1
MRLAEEERARYEDLKFASQVPFSLPPRYAIPGTEIPYGHTPLRPRYAIPGIGIPYDTITLRPRYAITSAGTACGQY